MYGFFPTDPLKALRIDNLIQVYADIFANFNSPQMRNPKKIKLQYYKYKIRFIRTVKSNSKNTPIIFDIP